MKKIALVLLAGLTLFSCGSDAETVEKEVEALESPTVEEQMVQSKSDLENYNFAIENDDETSCAKIEFYDLKEKCLAKLDS